MKNKVVINTYSYTDEYMAAIKFLLRKAGYEIDENYEEDMTEDDVNGDLAIYIPENDSTMQWVLNVLRECDVL